MSGLQEILGLVSEVSGLAFPAFRREAVEAEVKRCMERAGAPDEASFAALLRADSDLLALLIGAVTVGETWFFREPEQLGLLRSTILPEIIARRGPAHVLRAWSAGCSTGEEVWTLAIELAEMGLLRRRALVLGTDISPVAIEAARRRRYRHWALRRTAPSRLQRWLRQDGQYYEVDAGLEELVQFAVHNLAAQHAAYRDPTEMDLVVCRNVLIYMDHAARARVVEKLCAALAPGGWLVMGTTDPALADHRLVDATRAPAWGVYRRLGDSEQAGVCSRGLS